MGTAHFSWEAAAPTGSFIKPEEREGERELLETSGENSCRIRMHLLALLWTLGLLLKETQEWSYKNGIFHNSIWLGKELFLFSFCCRNTWLAQLHPFLSTEWKVVEKQTIQFRLHDNCYILLAYS